jgi:hypothetical protein
MMASVTAGISENILRAAGRACSQASTPQNYHRGCPISGLTAPPVALLYLRNPLCFTPANRVHRCRTKGTLCYLRLGKRPRPHLMQQTMHRLTLQRNSATKMQRTSLTRDGRRQSPPLRPRQYRISSGVSVRRLDIRGMARIAP